MAKDHISKWLLIVVLILSVSSIALFVTGCSIEDNNESQEQQGGDNPPLPIVVDGLRVEVDGNSHYDAQTQMFSYEYGEDVVIDKSSFKVFSVENGTETQIDSDNFTIDASELVLNSDNKVDAGQYIIRVSTADISDSKSIKVVVYQAKLNIPDTTEAQLSLSYNASDQSAVSLIDSLMEGDKLSDYISAGKVTLVDTMDNQFGTYHGINAGSYTFVIMPTKNYMIRNSDGTDLYGPKEIHWRIMRKELIAPTYANNGSVPFDWEVINEQLQMKTATMELQYGSGDEYVTQDMIEISGSLTLDHVGESVVTLNLKYEYSMNYAFKNGETYDPTIISLGAWRVTPYIFENSIQLTGANGVYVYNEQEVPAYDYSPEDITLATSLSAKEQLLFNFFDSGDQSIRGLPHYANLNNECYSCRIELKVPEFRNALVVNNSVIEQSTMLYYRVNRIDAPASILNAISNITFVHNSSIYGEYASMDELGYQPSDFADHTSGAIPWIDEAPGVVDYSVITIRGFISIANANETGYMLPLYYYYGYRNFKPIEIFANYMVERQTCTLSTIEYELTSNDGHNKVLGLEYTYRYNMPLVLSVENIPVSGNQISSIGQVSYTYSQTVDGEYASVSSALNAGFYEATMQLAVDGNYWFEVNDDLIDESWSIAQGENPYTWYLTRKFEIKKRPISFDLSYTGDWGTVNLPYSFYTGSNKTISANINAINLHYCVYGSNIISTTEITGDEANDVMGSVSLITKSGDTVVTPNAVGSYQTFVSYVFNNANYLYLYDSGEGYISVLDDIETIIDWDIISKTIDATGITWNETSFTYTIGANNYPEIDNLPRGLVITNTKFVYDGGTIDTSAPACGHTDYKVRVSFSIDSSIFGYDSSCQITYPTAYDTVNDYIEQPYTLTQRAFDYAAVDFCVAYSPDGGINNATYIATLDGDGNANIQISKALLVDGGTVRVMVVQSAETTCADVANSSYFNDDFAISSEFLSYSSEIGDEGTISGNIVPCSEYAKFATGIAQIAFSIHWTIVE